MTRRGQVALAGLLALAAVIVWLPALWLSGKAVLAQGLIDRAWHQGLAGDQARPWGHADFHPVARLSVPRLDRDWYVLSDASARTLAFGPGLLSENAFGGRVISGHRDTHFAGLDTLRAGEHLLWQGHRRARPERWQVLRSRVVHFQSHDLAGSVSQGRTVLVTCYPLDALSRATPWRYVVELGRVVEG